MESAESDGAAPPRLEKWADPVWTATGERRAAVALRTEAGVGATTLWFNTGTLCNIACVNCYIESSPKNDRLVYITAAEVADHLEQIAARGWPTQEIGFTGGEPFLNNEMIEIAEAALSRGHRVLILTNAMRPMLRKRMRAGLLDLKERYGAALVLRVSLDHYTAALHDEERGAGAFEKAMRGLRWLGENGFEIHIAGRTMWDEPEAAARAGYAALFAAQGLAIDADDPVQTMLFPEMTPANAPPEITESCWGVLNKHPSEVMCASSRMVVKRKGAEKPVYLACTLLPYDAAFELGETAAEAEQSVALKHPYCASFCVLGGGSCSG
ncbi:MAG: radical SAM protein [Pseudomonadota bacterium]